MVRRIASRKSSFFLIKKTFSFDSALISPPRTQLCSSALEQEKGMGESDQEEEDFS
jgi:hypothetical protein